jgi:hypothetical protein
MRLQKARRNFTTSVAELSEAAGALQTHFEQAIAKLLTAYRREQFETRLRRNTR